MLKRNLPALIVLSLLLTAAAGLIFAIGADGRTPITRLNFDPAQHIPRIYGEVVPPVDHDYPAVVARVNGEALVGDALMERQVQFESERLSFERNVMEAGLTEEELASFAVQFEEADPLELLIEEALLRQAVASEGMLPSHEEAKESVRLNEASSMEVIANAGPEGRLALEEALRLMGYPESDWASDERIVNWMRERTGLVRLREQVCNGPAGDIEQYDAVRGNPDCSAFLAAERAAADIEVYVRWVD